MLGGRLDSWLDLLALGPVRRYGVFGTGARVVSAVVLELGSWVVVYVYLIHAWVAGVLCSYCFGCEWPDGISRYGSVGAAESYSSGSWVRVLVVGEYSCSVRVAVDYSAGAVGGLGRMRGACDGWMFNSSAGAVGAVSIPVCRYDLVAGFLLVDLSSCSARGWLWLAVGR